MFDEV